MPLYDFKCKCGHNFEEIIQLSEKHTQCPKCNKNVEPDFNTSGVGSLSKMGITRDDRKVRDRMKREPRATHVQFDNGRGTKF